MDNNLVDVINLRDLGMLGHLIGLIDGLFVHALRDALLECEMRQWHIHDLFVPALRDALLGTVFDTV